MKRYFKYIIFLLVMLFNSCSLYNVSQNEVLNRVPYNKNNKELSTGTASIFLGTTDLNEYDVFSKILFNSTYRGVYMSFYENSRDVFFTPMQDATLYGVTTDSRLENKAKQKLQKINSRNIVCSHQRCKIFAQKSVYYITMFQGSTGNVDFEYIDFKKLKKKYIEAIRKYDISILSFPKERYIEKFIPTFFIFKAIDNASTQNELHNIQKIYTYLWNDTNIEFRKAIQWKSFLLDYDEAIQGSVTVKKKFLRKYNLKTYFKIKTNSLNIRLNPTIHSKVLGKYYKDDRFYVTTNKNGWGLSPKGWVFMKYVTKANSHKYEEKINNIRTQIFHINRKQILQQDSISIVKQYYLHHPKDLKVKHHLLQLYRQKGTVNSYYSAYRLSKNTNDLKLCLKEIKSIEQLNKFPLENNTLVVNKYASLYREKNTSNGFLKAFSYSKDKKDIKQSYLLAKTINEKKNIEYTLIKYFGIDKVFQLKGSLNGNKADGSSTARFNKIILRVIQSKGKASVNVKVSKKKNSKIPLKYGSYKIKIKIKLALVYHTVTFGIGMSNTEYVEKTFWVILNKQNKYKNNKKISFGEITQDFRGELLFKVSKQLTQINPIITFEDIELL